MENFVKSLEHPLWHRSGFPVDFESNKMFYIQPLFYPFLDFYLIKQLKFPKPSYPKGRFAVCITFDLDSFDLPKEAIRKSLKALKNTDIRSFLASLRELYLASRYINLEEYLELLARFKISATFFLAPAPGKDPRDPMYHLSDSIHFQGKKFFIFEIARFLHDQKHEIGLHPPIDTYCNLESLKKYKKQTESILGFSIFSVRQHWLMFDFENTSKIQFDAGFHFDSTYGFNRMPGFRAGTSYPFFFGKTSPLELPLLLQEGALLKDLKSGSMGLSLSKAIELGKNILRRVAKVGGIAVILVHPIRTGQDAILRKGWLKALIEYSCTLDAHFMTISEAGTYWKNQYKALHQKATKNINLNEVQRFWSEKCAAFLDL